MERFTEPVESKGGETEEYTKKRRNQKGRNIGRFFFFPRKREEIVGSEQQKCASTGEIQQLGKEVRCAVQKDRNWLGLVFLWVRESSFVPYVACLREFFSSFHGGMRIECFDS